MSVPSEAREARDQEVERRRVVGEMRAIDTAANEAVDRAAEARRVAAAVARLREVAEGDGLEVLRVAAGLVGAKVREIGVIALDDDGVLVATLDGAVTVANRATGGLLAAGDRRAAAPRPDVSGLVGMAAGCRVWRPEDVVVPLLHALAGRLQAAVAEGDKQAVEDAQAEHARLRRLLGRRALEVAPLEVDGRAGTLRRPAIGYASGWAS